LWSHSYYENKVSSETTWFNPLLEEKESPLAAIFAENWMEWDDKREEELEQVAGFEALIDRSRFEGGELKFAGSRLDKWLGRRGIEVTESDSLMLKWAEYANVERKVSDREQCEVWINVEDYPQLPQNLVRLASLTMSTTVRELKNLLFTRTTKQTEASSMCIDQDWTKGADNSEVYNRYVFKVVGCTDFLVHEDFALGSFDHIATCNARRMRIELLLVKLSENDALDLSGRMNEKVSAALDAIRQHRKKLDDDDYSADALEEAGRESLTKTNLSSAWDSNTHFPLESINWSFRVMVRGISGLTSALPEDFIDHDGADLSVQVQVALCAGNAFIQPPAAAKRGVAFSPTGVAGAGADAASRAVADGLDWESPIAMKTASLNIANGGCDQEWPGEWLNSPTKIKNLPAGARVCFRVVLLRTDEPKDAKEAKRAKKPIVVAGVSLPLVDFRRQLISGSMQVHMWPSEALQTARDKDIAEGEKDPQFLALEARPVGENPERNAGLLHLTFDQYELPVLAKRPCFNNYRARLSEPSADNGLPPSMTPDHEQRLKLEVIEMSSPLRALSESDKALVFRSRDYIQERPRLLTRLVESVDWTSASQVEEARMTLVRSEDAVRTNQAEISMLSLLDVKFGDPVVREFAVRQLDRLNDFQLAEVFLQLTQVLKYEPEHDSPLARMLLRRSIKNPLRLGQLFFWMLRSEMHVHSINDRYGLLIKLYLQRCGPHKTSLSRQLFINESLTSIAQAVHNVRPKKAKNYNAFVQKELKKLELPSKFSLCHAPRVELTDVVIEKAGVMTSKKLPLRLDFVNADPHARSPYRALFKCGDDLRQDLLTLQVLGVMERMWIEAGGQPRMIPYACASAGDQLGFIEWVTESTTTAWVQTHYGGKYGALKKENMRKHIAHHNKATGFETATDDFIASCCSYCVATYVLGIGDRHSDNIMVKENGMLFHIDFGHFLGNFKSKFGVKRERDNFVFTPDFCYVMGGAYVNNFGNVVEGDERNLFDKFEKMCGRAYNVLRENKTLLMDLFVLMIPAGMPELTKRSDVAFMDEKLMLQMSPDQAAKHFSKEINNALNTITRRIDNLAHTVKHYK